MRYSGLKDILASFPPYRLQQAEEAIFQNLLSDWEEATNIPRSLRVKLNRECPLTINARIREEADRNTIKSAITLADGAVIETVLLRHRAGRDTVCLSTQAGCALACRFCVTGQSGLRRDLTAEEMVEQVIFFARLLKEEGRRVSNVVFMGMGEPFLNYEETLQAAHIINRRLGIGARRISISTAGIPAGIRRLAEEDFQVNLALSLHAPREELRSRLMPVNRRHPLKAVMEAVADYLDRTGRRVMIEYLLLDGVNDTPRDARETARLLKKSLRRLFWVNLISYNPGGDFRPSPPDKVQAFQKILEEEGITVVCRYRFGREIQAACGQLAGGAATGRAGRASSRGEGQAVPLPPPSSAGRGERQSAAAAGERRSPPASRAKRQSPRPGRRRPAGSGPEPKTSGRRESRSRRERPRRSDRGSHKPPESGRPGGSPRRDGREKKRSEARGGRRAPRRPARSPDRSA